MFVLPPPVLPLPALRFDEFEFMLLPIFELPPEFEFMFMLLPMFEFMLLPMFEFMLLPMFELPPIFEFMFMLLPIFELPFMFMFEFALPFALLVFWVVSPHAAVKVASEARARIAKNRRIEFSSSCTLLIGQFC